MKTPYWQGIKDYTEGLPFSSTYENWTPKEQYAYEHGRLRAAEICQKRKSRDSRDATPVVPVIVPYTVSKPQKPSRAAIIKNALMDIELYNARCRIANESLRRQALKN